MGLTEIVLIIVGVVVVFIKKNIKQGKMVKNVLV